MSLKLFRISQTVNTGYDTYDSAVVVAKNEDGARKIHPDGSIWDAECRMWGHGDTSGIWAWSPPEHVTAEFVGIADERFHAGDVVCASFNAG